MSIALQRLILLASGLFLVVSTWFIQFNLQVGGWLLVAIGLFGLAWAFRSPSTKRVLCAVALPLSLAACIFFLAIYGFVLR
jgi:hypothetical protein